MDEDAIPSTFELGDLAWSRVGTAPYWPSVICHDPDTKKFTQVKESKRQGLHRVFHVKFFGGQRGKRAWVDQPHMLKFEGLEAFQELSNSATGSKQKAAFCPKYGNTKTIWLQAINECVSVVGNNDNMYKKEYSIWHIKYVLEKNSREIELIKFIFTKFCRIESQQL